MPRPKKPGRARFSFSRLSIQQRLPLLICILLLSVIVTFTCISYIGVKQASLKVGRERLQALTGQLTIMFQQSAQALIASTRVTANQEPIKTYLRSGGKAAEAEALNALHALKKDSLSALVQLLDSTHATVLEVGSSQKIRVKIDTALRLASSNPELSMVGKIYLAGDSMYFPVVVAVTYEKKVLGFVVRWRLVHSSPKTVDQLSQLLGTKASLYFGNEDGTLWTDMMKPVPGPPVAVKDIHNVVSYSRVKDNEVIATIQRIPNTRWLILVEFSKRAVLLAANTFLYWIIIAGVVLIAVGILMAWMMSRNITSPLYKLTAATSAIAAGDPAYVIELHRHDELGKLARAFNSMNVQIQNSKYDLEKRVQERTEQLQSVNKELEAFSYSVSHDLRAPLRAVSGYSMILKEDYEATLDAEGNRIIGVIISNAKMMGQLIDDLISFARFSRKDTTSHTVDMNRLVETCLTELLHNGQQNKYRLHIHSLPVCYGDQGMLKQVWMNLIGNAVKYSANEAAPVFEIGYKEDASMIVYFIKDNGVGFDMQYAHKLFGVFQRLHSNDIFEGTGVGLALVKRIINKHHGEVWAESSPGKGASFYFSLPKEISHES